MRVEVENAKITHVSLVMGVHGCLTFYITVQGAGFATNIGGYNIGFGYLDSNNFIAENGYGLEAMMNIMNVIGVERWEDLKEKHCRVKFDGLGLSVTTIGNIVKDKWFDIDDYFKQRYKEKGENNKKTYL